MSNTLLDNRKVANLKIGIAATLFLVIGMGFSRFAFTGLYPLMVHDGFLTVNSGTHAASANYIGYLIGALALGRLKPQLSQCIVICSMLLSVLMLFALGFAKESWLIISIRGLAGVFSATTMIAGSVWLFHYMHQHHQSALLYSGVGIGILLSAELIALGQHFAMNSTSIWIMLSMSCLVGFLFSVFYMFKDKQSSLNERDNAQSTGSEVPAFLNRSLQLVAIYGLAGFGYIITATYLPLLIKNSMSGFSTIHVWAVFGLGAIPSCFFWHQLRLKFGTSRSLFINLIIQALGVILPALSHTSISYLMSAFLVGGTFMGTVTIAMPAAHLISHRVKFNMLAGMTVAYGIGQIIGPLVANSIYQATYSFDGSLFIAALALCLAAILSVEKFAETA